MPSRASFALAMTALVAVLVAAPLARAPVARAAGAPDGLPAVLPREADVRDPVLSLLERLRDDT